LKSDFWFYDAQKSMKKSSIEKEKVVRVSPSRDLSKKPHLDPLRMFLLQNFTW